MKKLKNKLQTAWSIYAPIWLQVAVDLWWLVLLIILFFAGLFIFILSLVHILSNPELIGQFFGEITKGFNEALK